MNADKTCIYHDDKENFDVVTRDIEKAKLIPTQYARRLAMCVCSCRKNKFDLNGRVKQLELQNMADDLQNLTTEKWPRSLVGLLKPILKNVCILQYSQSMMVLVLYRAIKEKNFEMLENKKKPVNAVPIKSKEQNKMTPTQFNFMINRKLRSSSYVVDLCLPLFAGNWNMVVNGEKTKQLQLHHKDIVIKVDHKANTQFMDKNIKKTKIKMAGKCKKDVDSFGRVLHEISANMQALQDRKHAVEVEKRKEAKSFFQSYFRDYHDHLDGTVDIEDDYKEDMTDLYTRRCTSNRIGNKTKTEGESPLKDGHCINCLEKFTTLKNSGECKYHPGFINRDKKWSCCGVEAETDTPSLKEHRDTGCFTSGVHNWRHGKDSRKNKKHRNVTKTFKTAKVHGRKYDIEY